nr:transcriptional regulator [Bacteroidota bacterium]
MIGVITGDIINSQRTEPAIWLKALKEVLENWGKTPKQWEIYRGDSFQLEIKNPADALEAALQIKAAVKSIRGTDVRMAIGIGDKSHNAEKVTESNGSAFVYSGELAEELKRLKLNLAIRSHNTSFNSDMNLYLKLLIIIIDGWSDNAAKTVFAALQQPDQLQVEIGKQLGIKQNAVSSRLKRAHFDEIIEVIRMYNYKIAEL